MKQSNDEYFMKEALKEAEKGFEEKEIPVGAVVTCKGRIIARAHNQVERLNDATAHAEMIALTSASAALQSKYLPECRLYVTLEPCVMCAGSIFWIRPGCLIFGAHDPQRGFSHLRERIIHPKTKVVTGIYGEISLQLLQAFFRIKRDESGNL